MGLKLVYKMKNIILFSLCISLTFHFYSQEHDSDYHKLFKGSETYPRSIKNLYCSQENIRMDSITGNTYFLIDGERFMYNPKQQSTQIIPKKHSENI